jgi:hypothetical protein
LSLGRFRRSVRGILKPDLPTSSDGSIDLGVGLEERVQGAYQTTDPVAAEREATGQAH